MIWHCREKEIEYGNKILLMGIVNVTTDSFSDGCRWLSPAEAVSHALALEEQGADILDFGAQSTRPGYEEISPEEEWARLAPVLEEIRKRTALPISVDTYFPWVAENAVKYGADIINDISGVVSPAMAKIVKESACGWILMHHGAGGCREVKTFFDTAVSECEAQGVAPSQLCLDMGIGFGKTYEQNLELIANVGDYKKEGFPLLLGTSRKRVIARSSGQSAPEKRVFGNIAADTAAILGGVDIIRLHDIQNEKQGIFTAQELKKWTR